MSNLTSEQIGELKHFHIFGDGLVPITNKQIIERELHEMKLIDRSGPEVVFSNHPSPSHWRYSLNDAGRAAIVEVEGCLPKPYEYEGFHIALVDE